jgi:dTDP-4-dehydrorhamnose reductase
LKVVVLGSVGQLGQDLMHVFGEDSMGLTHQDLDVTDGVGVMETMETLKPDWVLNTAAFHRVDECQSNPTLAFDVNCLGAFNVARASSRVGAGIVFFSTDYVFGGIDRESRGPYNEEDCPQPVNVYGVSKLSGERMVAQANPRHCVIRSSALYGTATSRKGWTFPELMVQKAKAGEKIRVVVDQVVSPTYTRDMARRVKEIVDMNATGVFHVVNSGECSWFTFARTVLEYVGANPKIEPVDTMRTQRRAIRPPYTALCSTHLETLGLLPLRPWQDALRDYLHAKGIV